MTNQVLFIAATPCNPLGRFLAKAQNDKAIVILTCLVILSVAKYPRIVSFLLICVDFSLASLTQNDKSGVDFSLCANALRSK